MIAGLEPGGTKCVAVLGGAVAIGSTSIAADSLGPASGAAGGVDGAVVIAAGAGAGASTDGGAPGPSRTSSAGASAGPAAECSSDSCAAAVLGGTDGGASWSVWGKTRRFNWWPGGLWL